MRDYEKDPVKKHNATDHLANERTLLAWIRTGIGIMAFGFVVVKFSLFIRQISFAFGSQVAIPQYGYSAPIGILLVVAGAVSLILSVLRYRKTKQQLIEGNYYHSSGFFYAIVAFVLLISIVLVVYLVSTSL